MIMTRKNTLYIAFYGKQAPDRVEWHHEIISTQKAPDVTTRNPNLPKGTSQMVLEGMDGATVKSWVTITKNDGTSTVKNLGISSYRPMPNVIEVSE
jgi:vancomycin resistance protein YoaR